MSIQLEASEYFTKKQSNLRFVQRPQKPLPPKAVSVSGTGLMISGKDQYAYLDLNITSPDTPSWANAPQYIQAFTVKFTDANGNVGTRTFNFYETLRLPLLVAGMVYTIAVAVTDYLGQTSDFTTTFTSTTAADTTAPAAPTITVTALGVGALITVEQLNTEPDFSGYDLFRDTDPALKSNLTLLPCAHFNGKQYTDLSLPGAGAYYYFLRAKDFSGNVQDSATVGPTNLIASATPPPAIISLTGATATANADGTITFSFPTPTDSNLKYYNIWRKRAGGNWVLLDTVAPGAPASSFSYTDLSAVNGSLYAYAASVVDIDDATSVFDPAGQITATANDTTAPSPIPNSIQYLGQLGSIQATWQASADPSAQFYLIQWRYAQLGVYSAFNAGVLVVGTSFTIYGLTDPTTGIAPTRDALSGLFEVRISSVDSSNNQSAFITSGPVQFPQLAGYRPADNSVPPAPVLSAPVINNDGSITLSWTAPAISDLYGYIIEELESGGSQWEQIQAITDSTSGTKQVSIAGLDPYNFNQLQYRFRVRTLDNSQNISGANLLDDPSFTLQTWGFASAPTYVTPGRNGIGQALRASANMGVNQVVPVTAGIPYSVSGYCSKDVISGLSALIEIHWLAAGGSEISVSSGVSLALVDGYQQWTNSVVAPALAVSAKLVLISDAVSRDVTALWDDIQFEQGARATPYGDGKTAWLKACDTAAPSAYTTNFLVGGQWGYFDLNWVNGTDPSYVNCVYEIWRKRLASDAPGFVADSGFVKVVEIPGHNDGKANHWSDDIPSQNERMQVQYGLRPRDRFGNAAVDGGGNPVFMTTSPTVTSLNTNDRNFILNMDTQVSDGTNYSRVLSSQLQNGVINKPFGSSLLANPGFELNATLTPMNVPLAVGAIASDGWTVARNDLVATRPTNPIGWNITASPCLIPVSSSNITIYLTNTNAGVPWVPGTSPFVIDASSHPSGCIIVSQVITSSTTATVVVSTGTGTGYLELNNSADTIYMGRALLTVYPPAGATTQYEDSTTDGGSPSRGGTRHLQVFYPAGAGLPAGTSGIFSTYPTVAFASIPSPVFAGLAVSFGCYWRVDTDPFANIAVTPRLLVYDARGTLLSTHDGALIGNPTIAGATWYQVNGNYVINDSGASTVVLQLLVTTNGGNYAGGWSTYFMGGSATVSIDDAYLKVQSNIDTDVVDGSLYMRYPSVGGIAFRNRFMNGLFRIKQGNPGTINNFFAGPCPIVVDRYYCFGALGITGQRIAGLKSQYALQITMTGNQAGSLYPVLGHHIPLADLADLVGQTVTISFYLYGTGDHGHWALAAPSAPDNWTNSFGLTPGYSGVEMGTGPFSGDLMGITSTPQLYTITFVVPSIAATNGLGLEILPGGISGTFIFEMMKFELGTVRTVDTVLPYGLELAMCQRFYESNYPVGSPVGSSGMNANLIYIPTNATQGSLTGQLLFKVPKQRVPSAVWFYTYSGASGWHYGRLGATETVFTPANIGVSPNGIYWVNYSIPTNTDVQYGMFAANAEL